MPNVQQNEDSPQPDIRVSFQVTEDFKLAIDRQVTEERTTLKEFCIRALAEKLGIPVPGEEPQPDAPRKRRAS